MEEWWGKTHELLIEGGLTYDAIKKSLANSSIAFREGVTELFEFLEEKEIPVLIFSAGLADVMEEVLRQNLHRSFKNVKIVSNRMMFNDEGQLVSFKEKLSLYGATLNSHETFTDQHFQGLPDGDGEKEGLDGVEEGNVTQVQAEMVGTSSEGSKRKFDAMEHADDIVEKRLKGSNDATMRLWVYLKPVKEE